MDAALILAERFRRNPLVELVSVGEALGDLRVEPAERVRDRVAHQAQADGPASATWHVQGVVCRGFGAGLGRVHGVAMSRDDVGVEGVLDVGRGIGLAPETDGVAVILGEEQFGTPITVQTVLAKLLVRDVNDTGSPLTQ